MNPKYKKEQGQAMVETLVATLALTPLFIAIPHIGKLLDIKHANNQSARYAAFERSIHSAGNWGIGESTKSDAAISQEVRARIQSNPNTRIQTGSNAAIPNSLWTGHNGESIVSSSAEITLSGRSPGIDRGYGMNTLLNGSVPSLEKISLNTNDQGMVVANSSMTALNLPDISQRGVTTTIHSNNTDSIEFKSSLALLTNPWMAGSEENFGATMAQLTLDESLYVNIIPGCVVWGGGPSYAVLTPFPEGKKCFETDLKSQTAVVLDGYLDKENRRDK